MSARERGRTGVRLLTSAPLSGLRRSKGHPSQGQMSRVERSGQRGLGRARGADTLGQLIDSAVTPVNYSS